ncbi:MAG: lipopolysaccharide heptosyltransferase II [Candidatus Omnitrophica bacterium]|jgi:heptosyltransferase-2|nr:lipopolysaccharide heptosyltransferase II [Candidatus Omnitrophota bacterium]
MVKEPKRILIVRTDRLGDVILSTAVVENLRLAFPKARLAFMCRPYTASILEYNPYLNEVIIYDKDNKHKSFPASLKFAFYLRRKKFDWAIILHPTNRVHIVTFLARIPIRVGWNRKYSFLLTKKIEHTKQKGLKHELEYTLDILRHLNIPIRSKETYFPVIEAAQTEVANLLKKEGLKDTDKIIAIHPSASCPSKRWPQSNFCKLTELLKQKIDAKIVVITSESEKEFGAEIVKKEDVIDFRGKLNILGIGALLKRSVLFISNDSGPVHIAASLGIPVISIFGRSDAGLSPARWKPLGKESFYFHKDVGCQICLAHNCQKDFLCLKEITPEEVAFKAISIIGKRLNL